MPAGPLALIAAVAIGCYLNSLAGALLFDDLPAITNNPAVTDFDLGAILTAPVWWYQTGYISLYRPVTTLTFALDYLVHGANPVGYHVVNVGLHAAVSVGLALVLARVTGSATIAVITGIVFAAHPVHTEAVASVVGRAEELAALFALLAWYLLLRFPPGARHRMLGLATAGVALVLGVLSKESAAAVVAVVVAADLIYRRKPDTVALVVATAAALGALTVRTAITGGLTSSPDRLDNVLAGAPYVPRVLTALEVVALYMRTLVWPLALSADYSYRQIDLVTSAADPGFLAGLGVLLVAVSAAVWGWYRNRHVCFAIAWAALTFSVVSNLFLPIGTIMAERLLYLPSAGFCLLVAVALERLARATAHRATRGPVVAYGLAGALVAFYATGTWVRNRVWREPLAFFEALVASAPASARSHRELGLLYSNLGRHDAAEAEMQAALRIDGDNAVTLYDLGNVLMRRGRNDDAIAAYTASLSRKPGAVATITNLGNAHSARGDEAAAETWFRRGLAIDPAAAELHMNLGNSLFRQGRGPEAESAYRQAVALAPRRAIVHLNYGAFLSAVGRHREAAEQYRAAVSLAPGSPALVVRYVAALSAAGLRDEARAAQARAERLFPADPSVRSMRQHLERR